MLKTVVRKALPPGVRRVLRDTVNVAGELRTDLHLARMRRRAWTKKPGSLVRFLGYTVRITDGPNFYVQYKDVFIHRIYHFEAVRADPLIIDGGSNMGMSILYFKHVYPAAHIIGFEPDPEIFCILQENIIRNGLKDVILVNASLGASSSTETFLPDGSAGGHLGGEEGITGRIECLSDYLNDPVDFVKLNIEGEEFAVVQEAEASGKLCNVRELILEYHGWAGGEQRLGAILDLLDRKAFRYLTHDFDAETCGASKPPFRLTPQTTCFCLVYARRLDGEFGPAEGLGSRGKDVKCIR